jgi:hypothetical protein
MTILVSGFGSSGTPAFFFFATGGSGAGSFGSGKKSSLLDRRKRFFIENLFLKFDK